MQEELIEYLSKFVTEKRKHLFEENLKKRTSYLTVVLEDIYQSHNASAVLRSCDCFGVQNVHIIENRNQFAVNANIALGASKWLSIHKHNKSDAASNTIATLKSLKQEGYRIVATTPNANDVNLEDFDLSAGKTALVFGTELLGISDDVKEHADEFLKIPMVGFTESFNLSVSVAICLHHLTWKLRNDPNIHWQLTKEENNFIHLNWLRQTIKKSKFIEEDFLKNSESILKHKNR